MGRRDSRKARLDEEAAAEKAIADLEGLDIDSDDFVTGYTKLCADVVAHAENEEHQEFNKLSGDFTEVQMARINAGAALAEGAVSGNGVEGESFVEMFNYAKTHIDAASQQPDHQDHSRHLVGTGTASGRR